MPRTCLQELAEKQKGGILDFHDTLTNKVMLLTEKETFLGSKYKPRNRPRHAHRAARWLIGGHADTDMVTACAVLGGCLVDLPSQKSQAFVWESRVTRIS